MPQEYLKLELTTTLKALELDSDTIAVLAKATFKLAYMYHKKKYDALSRGYTKQMIEASELSFASRKRKMTCGLQAVLDGNSKDSS